MFRLEAHLISDTYAGEKFGNGLYYRLIWGCPLEEKKLEIFLVFEEQLCVNMMGKILGLKTNNLNSMLLHAVRHSSQQLVTRAMECFPDLIDCSQVEVFPWPFVMSPLCRCTVGHLEECL